MKKYAILNPLDGQYQYVNTKSECGDVLSNIAFNFYLAHTHNNPVSIVEYFDDGSEKWTNNDGEMVLSKEFLEAAANNFLINVSEI